MSGTATASNKVDVEGLPPLLTVREAGQILGIANSAAYRMDARGELPTLGTGQRRVVKARLLDCLRPHIEATKPTGPDERSTEQ